MSAGEVRPEGVAVFRGLIIAFAVTLFTVGILATILTVTVNGWWVLSLIAVGIGYMVRDRPTPEERKWRAVSAYFERQYLE